MFTITITSGTPEELDAAAEALAEFISSDATDPGENRDAWASDFALRTKLEIPLGNDAQQWDLVAGICRRTLRRVSEPSAVALIMLLILNAERQLPSPETKAINTLFGVVRPLITALPTGRRRERLETLLDHHAGIWARTTGDYRTAAEIQSRASEQARLAGKNVDAAIAELCKCADLLNDALVRGTESRTLVVAVQAAAHSVVIVCCDTRNTTHRVWSNENAPIHVLLAHIWSETPIASGEGDFWACSLSQSPCGSNPLIMGTVRAGMKMLCCRYHEAAEYARQALASDATAHEQWSLTAGLVFARSSQRLGITTDVETTLRRLAEPHHTMHQIRALARKALGLGS